MRRRTGKFAARCATRRRVRTTASSHRQTTCTNRPYLLERAGRRARRIRRAGRPATRATFSPGIHPGRRRRRMKTLKLSLDDLRVEGFEVLAVDTASEDAAAPTALCTE